MNVPFAYDAWYPLAWSRDVGHRLITRRIWEEDLVVFRTRDGLVAVLEDACPHRLAPLSLGTLRGDAVECGYHGLTFDCSGKCVSAPGMPRPPSAKVRSFPAAESMGMVWVWMGDPTKADRTQVFHLPEYDDPQFSVVEGDALPVRTNYLNLADNLCDPTHVVYVHKTTLASAGREETRVQNERQGNKVITWRWVIDGPLIPVFEGLKDFDGANVDRWHYYHYHAPCIAIIDFGSARTGTGAPEGNREDCIQMFACHFITPIDQHSCMQHWLCLKNSPADPEVDARLLSNLRLAFNEDKQMLEAIQRNEDKPREWKRVNLALDASSIKMRRIVEEMATPPQ